MYTSHTDEPTIQVVLRSCPAHAPFVFARHCWFEVVREAEVTRYEVLFRKRRGAYGEGYVAVNAFLPGQGIEIIPFCTLFHWPARTIARVTGGIATSLAAVLERSLVEYPYRDRYALLGPNSNTYVWWVLDHAPDVSITIPARAFGRRWGAYQRSRRR